MLSLLPYRGLVVILQGINSDISPLLITTLGTQAELGVTANIRAHSFYAFCSDLPVDGSLFNPKVGKEARV